MRRGHLIVVVAALACAPACSSSTPKAAPSTTTVNIAATTSSAPPTTAAAPTTPSATVGAVTSSASPSSSSLPATTEPPTTVNQLIRCETSSTTTGGLCVGITVPLPSDADQIIAAYLTFAKKYLEVQTNPDNPDWDGFLALVAPEVRAEARKEIEDHFKRGEVLNVRAGVSFDTKLSRLRYPPGFIELEDCRTDGSYWADRATGQPVPGQVTTVSHRPVDAGLELINGKWVRLRRSVLCGGRDDVVGVAGGVCSLSFLVEVVVPVPVEVAVGVHGS